eukprot:11663363-Alexandrium_andersonii.AAC.1
MSASLVGSEMCIRDRDWMEYSATFGLPNWQHSYRPCFACATDREACSTCLLYTSDAADDM